MFWEPGILLKTRYHLFHILHNIAALLGLHAKWKKRIHKQNIITWEKTAWIHLDLSDNYSMFLQDSNLKWFLHN